MVENLVCDCWNEQKPGGFESVSSWLDAAEAKYLESSQNTLKSKMNGLAQKQLILEIKITLLDLLKELFIVKFLKLRLLKFQMRFHLLILLKELTL